MAMEILMAKLIGPYFGASLYVWAATIGTTLIGLASGYYYAGILAEKENTEKKLLLISLISSIYILILPTFSSLVMQGLIELEVVTGILISTTIFNLPLFFLFGLYSPLIIQVLSSSIEESGNYAGRIYGLSTVSGVLFLLVIGIYILPNIGAYIPVYICAALMLLAAGIQYIHLNKVEK